MGRGICLHQIIHLVRNQGTLAMGIGLFLLFFSQLVVGFEDNLGWEMGIVAPLQDL